MPTCETVKLVPGPKGDAGTNGTNGTNGLNAYTFLTSNFTMPAIGATAVAAVGASGWITVGQPIYLQNAGVMYVTAITDSTHVTLRNPAAETGNVAAGTVVPLASKLSPSGFKGPAGTTGAAGTGVSVTTKGDLQTHDGTNPSRQAVGTDGQMIRARAAAGNGLDWATIIPNATAATDDNKIAVANCPVGTEKPAPLQFILAKVTDTGAFETVGGNARGVDAVDMQPARSANTEVSSGDNSTIGGGRNNESSGQGSTVSGGEGNVASGLDAVAAGQSNTASGDNSGALSGRGNIASNDNAVVSGGAVNTASSTNSVVCGGNANTSSGSGSFNGSGSSCTASGQRSAVITGSFNQATAGDSLVGVGQSNIASKQFSFIPNGAAVRSDKYGQHAHNNGNFAAAGDCQTSELIWRRSTTDATPTEMFLDGSSASERAVVPTNTTWAFHIIGVARRDDGTSITFEVKGGIKNDAGTVVLVAAVTASVIADGTGAALTIANFTVSADDPNNSLKILVTGIAAQNWRWVAHARLVEVSY